MKGDIDDLQIRYRKQLYRRITIKPHIPLTAARRSSRRPALAEMLDAVTAGHGYKPRLSPGIISAFRHEYRQLLASGLKAATDRSCHGGLPPRLRPRARG